MSPLKQRFDSEVEREIASRLLERGIFVVTEFQVPGSGHRADFLLPTPPFGIVEVKSRVNDAAGLRCAIEQVTAQLALLRPSLGAGTRGYVAIVGAPTVETAIDSALPDGVVLCASDDAMGVADLVADDFLAHGVRHPGKGAPPSVTAKWAADDDALTATLSQLTLNLDQLLADDERAVLQLEVDHLRDEITHGHFTAAALRVGRSLEFIVYAACRSWGVPVRQPILVGLKTLDGKFAELRKALLTYAGIDDGSEHKRRAKQQYAKKTGELHSVLSSVIADIDDQVAARPDTKNVPVNPRALMNDIRSRYARHPEVRTAIEDAAKPTDQLLEMRNDAAHASLEGRAREVDRGELAQMIESLAEVILCLSRCGTTILKDAGGDA